jgi:hypothetical protein
VAESVARVYIAHAERVLKEQSFRLSVTDRALLCASLAQAYASLEVVDAIRSGIRLGYAEELANAMNHLARKMPDR